MENQLLVQILAACATLIGFIVFFFIIDWYSYKKALRDMKEFKKRQAHRTSKAKKGK